MGYRLASPVPDVFGDFASDQFVVFHLFYYIFSARFIKLNFSQVLALLFPAKNEITRGWNSPGDLAPAFIAKSLYLIVGAGMI